MRRRTIGQTTTALLLALTAALAAVALSAAPALAQASDQYDPGGGAVEETDLVAELTAECPENANRVVGYQLVTTGVESRTAVPLTDEDDDGVLTGTQTFPRFPPGPQPPPGSGAEPITVTDVRIVAPDGGTIKQFGPVRLDREEIVLEASVSLCDGGSGPDPRDGGQYDPGDGSDRQPGGGVTQLPETGGAPLATALGPGALLGGAGLLLRRMRR